MSPTTTSDIQSEELLPEILVLCTSSTAPGRMSISLFLLYLINALVLTL